MNGHNKTKEKHVRTFALLFLCLVSTTASAQQSTTGGSIAPTSITGAPVQAYSQPGYQMTPTAMSNVSGLAVYVVANEAMPSTGIFAGTFTGSNITTSSPYSDGTVGAALGLVGTAKFGAASWVGIVQVITGPPGPPPPPNPY